MMPHIFPIWVYTLLPLPLNVDCEGERLSENGCGNAGQVFYRGSMSLLSGRAAVAQRDHLPRLRVEGDLDQEASPEPLRKL